VSNEAAAATGEFDVRFDRLIRRLGEPAPGATLEPSPRFVVIESA
jgi:hypothetical protein